MTAAEMAICARLRAFREHITWSQPAFAAEVGITRDQLANIECGRTPVRYELAARISDRFKLSEVWLAGKAVNPKSQIGFDSELKSTIPPGLLFSEAFEQYLWPQVSASQRKLINDIGPSGIRLLFPPAGAPPDKRHVWPLMQEVRDAIKALPDHQRDLFIQAVLDAIVEFYRARGLKYDKPGYIRTHLEASASDAPQQIALYASQGDWKKRNVGGKEQTRIGQVLLDTTSSASDKDDMQSVTSLPGLRKKLKELAGKLGSNAALARKLDVSRQAVDQWLKGDTKPSAEVLIKVMNMQ